MNQAKQIMLISLLRSGPQELQYSVTWMWLLVVLNVAFSLVTMPEDITLTQSLLIAIVDAALIMLLANLLLSWRKKENRDVQTLTALFGTGLLFSVLIMIVDYVFTGSSGSGTTLDIVLVVLMLWYVLACAHIFKEALEMTIMPMVFLVISYLITSWSLAGMIAPQLMQAAQ